jgi:hypothetical protein
VATSGRLFYSCSEVFSSPLDTAPIIGANAHPGVDADHAARQQKCVGRQSKTGTQRQYSEKGTSTGSVSCSTSLTFFIASGRWHRWVLGCHSSPPGVLSGMGFSRCCGEQMPSARNARPNGRQRPAHTSGLALNRRHARSEEMGAANASDRRIAEV